MSQRRRFIALLCVGVAGIAVAGVAVLHGLSDTQYASKPQRLAVAHEYNTFETPKELLRASDLVVIGHVEGEGAPGRERGELDGDKLTDRIVKLRVEQVVARGPKADPILTQGANLQVLDGYWDQDREGVVLNNVTWAPRGARGLFFLHKMEGEETYRLTSSYGRILYGLDPDKNGPSGEEPFEALWHGSQSRLVSLETAAAYVASLVGGAQ